MIWNLYRTLNTVDPQVEICNHQPSSFAHSVGQSQKIEIQIDVHQKLFCYWFTSRYQQQLLEKFSNTVKPVYNDHPCCGCYADGCLEKVSCK